MVKKSKNSRVPEIVTMPAEPTPIDWTIDTSTMAGHGMAYTRTATEAELTAVATALGLIGIAALDVRARVDRPSGDIYFVTTRVEADLTQACVVTLEPVPARVDLKFTTEFRPAAELAEAVEDVDVEDPVEVEPLIDGDIPIGRVVFEELAAGLDLYPRKSGASFSDLDAVKDMAKDAAKQSPFAVLARLKDKNS